MNNPKFKIDETVVIWFTKKVNNPKNPYYPQTEERHGYQADIFAAFYSPETEEWQYSLEKVNPDGSRWEKILPESALTKIYPEDGFNFEDLTDPNGSFQQCLRDLSVSLDNFNPSI